MSAVQITKNTRKRKNEETEPEKPSKRPKAKPANYNPQWEVHELLAEEYDLNLKIAENISKLFEEENTIPFIARYRQNATNNMDAEQLRALKASYSEMNALKNKISTTLKKLEANEQCTDQVKTAIRCSRSIEELEYICAPYKAENKRSLAERAKELGLEPAALSLLNDEKHLNLSKYVKPDEKDLCDVAAVETGLVNIIAAIMSKDTEILSALRELRKKMNFLIQSKKAAAKKAAHNKENDKFDSYFNFEMSVKHIKSHQVLAINRGEKLKILSVKIIVPDEVYNKFKNLCLGKFLEKKCYPLKEKILRLAVDESYHRLVAPLMKREMRHELKQKAEIAACEVFSKNLKQLLLTSPFKGQPIMGIDPGYSNGCKIAVVSVTGSVLDTDVIYPHTNKSKSRKDESTLRSLLMKHGCELIALGNGTACRQTEEWLSYLIQKNAFAPLDVKYTIVREEGASIYSCGSEAKKEFPKLNPNIISAISLARRVQDPLAELIKVEPMHLGIGMYQHDMKKKQLEENLNDVVSECVSFVGVDLNTASQCLLKHVAGLSEKRAQQVVDFRSKNGSFKCRKQLLEVTGIGQKIFLQCAGFLRVGPQTSDEASTFYKNANSTKFDRTNIHPESYRIAEKIIQRLNLNVADVGEEHFILAMKNTKINVDDLSEEFQTNSQNIQLIVDALSKPLNHDFRSDFKSEPIFKKGLMSIKDIWIGSVLTGVVSNVTDFGSFVDIGVGCNGLIHKSKYNGLSLEINKKVEVKVVNLEIERQRIGLQALRIIG